MVVLQCLPNVDVWIDVNLQQPELQVIADTHSSAERMIEVEEDHRFAFHFKVGDIDGQLLFNTWIDGRPAESSICGSDTEDTIHGTPWGMGYDDIPLHKVYCFRRITLSNKASDTSVGTLRVEARPFIEDPRYKPEWDENAKPSRKYLLRNETTEQHADDQMISVAAGYDYLEDSAYRKVVQGEEGDLVGTWIFHYRTHEDLKSKKAYDLSIIDREVSKMGDENVDEMQVEMTLVDRTKG